MVLGRGIATCQYVTKPTPLNLVELPNVAAMGRSQEADSDEGQMGVLPKRGLRSSLNEFGTLPWHPASTPTRPTGRGARCEGRGPGAEGSA